MFDLCGNVKAQKIKCKTNDDCCTNTHKQITRQTAKRHYIHVLLCFRTSGLQESRIFCILGLLFSFSLFLNGLEFIPIFPFLFGGMGYGLSLMSMPPFHLFVVAWNFLHFNFAFEKFDWNCPTPQLDCIVCFFLSMVCGNNGENTFIFSRPNKEEGGCTIDPAR